MKQREIVVEHKYVDGIYSHCFDNENYALLELERKVYLNENKELEDRINKAIEYIENDLQISILPNNQIINGTEVVKRINKIIEILKGSSDKE